jgi:hypothetical protein
MAGTEEKESSAAAGADGVTLDRLRQILGPLVLEILCAPRGVAIQVGPQVIYGPDEPVPSEVDGLLLMVGMKPDDDTTLDAIRRAGEAGYCAVALKARGADLTAAVAAADEAAVALVVVPDDMAWRRVDSLITAATSASSR